MQHKIIPGIDSFLQINETGKNSRYALVTNDAAFTSGGILSRVAIIKSGVTLVKLFSPEHGISAAAEDGMFQKHSADKQTGLPVISLYGDRLMPSEEDLSDIDIVLFDIPDVGCRFYTYLWTMTYVMEACALYKKQLIILDRPNPISGNLSMAEGPILDEKNCSSFIGRWIIPIRHSCTIGELAVYFAKKKNIDLDLKVIQVKNWSRIQMAGTAGFDFSPTSPAIRNIETALLYPGMGLLEGVSVNEGRGTDKPFCLFGAPWIDADELLNGLIEKKIPGITARPLSYIPKDSLYKGDPCYGLELTITDKNKLRPVYTGIEILRLLIQLYPTQVEERSYKTNANPSGIGHLDKLLGIHHAFKKIKEGFPVDTVVSPLWANALSPFVLYD